MNNRIKMIFMFFLIVVSTSQFQLAEKMAKKRDEILKSKIVSCIDKNEMKCNQIIEEKEKKKRSITIVLKDGTEIKGKFLSDSENSVTIETEMGSKTIKKELILETKPPLESFQVKKEEREIEIITIVLKDGTEIKGKFLSDSENSVTIETETGSKTIKKELILETKPPLETILLTEDEKKIEEKTIIIPIIKKEEEKKPTKEKQVIEEKDRKQKKRFPLSFYINGNYSFINGDDLNSHISGKSEQYSDSNDYFDWERLKNISDFNFEIIYNLSKYIGIGIGAGYLSKKNQGTYGWIQSDGDYFDYSREYEISAQIFSGNIHVNFPLGKHFNIIFSGGGDYYLGKLKHEKLRVWDYYYSRPVLWYSIWTWWGGWTHYYINVPTRTFGDSKENENAECNTFGFHGSVGIEVNILSNVSLVVEGLYRYIKFNDYYGSYEYESSNSEGSQLNGNLWYYGTDTPIIQIHENQPSDSRKAEINLSGFSIRTGIMIRF